MRLSKDITNRQIGLLLIPAAIAYGVGMYAPTVVGNESSICMGIIYGLFILFIDYNFIALKMKHKGLLFIRGLLILFSIIMTAIVGEQIIYHDDIEIARKEQAVIIQEAKVLIAFQSWEVAVAKQDAECSGLSSNYTLHGKLITSSRKAGKGPLCESKLKVVDQAYNALEIVKNTEPKANKAGVLNNMKILLKMSKDNPEALLLMILIFVIISIAEALPIFLKSQKTESELKAEQETLDIEIRNENKKNLERSIKATKMMNNE